MGKRAYKKGYFYAGLTMFFFGLVLLSYSAFLANSSGFVKPLVVLDDAEEFLENRTLLFVMSSASLFLMGLGVFFISNSREVRGQAAMEFLMTYGWAILAVIIAIGVLAYFGVFKVALGPPDYFVLGAPLGAVSAEVVDGGAAGFIIKLEVQNGFYEALQIKGIIIDIKTPSFLSGERCEEVPNQLTQNFPKGSAKIYDVDCPIVAALIGQEGQKIKADIKFKYKTSSSSLERISNGELLYTIR